MSISETACTYAALILHDEGIPITAEKILTLVNAANVKVESYWPSLIAKLLEKKDAGDLIQSIGSGGACVAAAPAVGGGAAAAAAEAPKVEEKKEEPQEESDEDMGFSLFD
eukprot:TRINITY_DN35631_c0_g1_i1.p1 TRINITY_DN35631_c0_g1~~TRINITY_DN35631_c0_g1_i1.p1  ORF type:complete len:111 (-),score=34.46 TRINITY_DN35631_c0_g1_i1:214-546(-)